MFGFFEDPSDDFLEDFFEEHQSEIERREQIEDRIPDHLKFCSGACGRSIVELTPASGDRVGDDEYIAMVNIVEDNNGIGSITYICGKDISKSALPPL